MSNEYVENVLKSNVDSFLVELEKLFDDERLTLVKQLQDKNKNDFGLKQNIYKFVESLQNDDLFKLLLRSKIKLFSSKTEETNNVSESLFGVELTLKSIFNNRSNKTKRVLWSYLHLFYFLIENNLENKSEERINKLAKLLKDEEDEEDEDDEQKESLSTGEISDKVKKDILNVDVNDSTNNLIDDIVSSFQSSLDGNSENPFDCIMDITEQITEKYKDKLANGEIELDKMMGSITKSIPGVENLLGKKNQEPQEKVVIDENFSTDQVELGDKDKQEGKGFQLSGMMKMMNSMNGKGGGPNLKGLMDVMGKLNSVKTEDEAKELKGEMDSFLEKELGLDVSKLNDTIGKIEAKQQELVKQDEQLEENNKNVELEYNHTL